MATAQRTEQRTAVTLILLFPLFYAACKNPDEGNTRGTHLPAPPAIPISNWSVRSYLPHDTALFTEGFLVHDGKIFESTGSPDEDANAESLVGIIDPGTGRMDRKIRLD